MALVSIVQRCQRQLQKRAGSRPNDPVVTTGTRIYRAICSADEPQVAEAACPKQLGNIWSSDRPNLRAIAMATEEVENAGPGRAYDVTVEFSDESESPDGGGSAGPTIEVSFEFAATTEDVFRAEAPPRRVKADGSEVSGTWRWGNSIRNSAGEPLPQGIAKTFFDAVVVIDREEDTWDLAKQIQMQDSINANSFSIRYRDRTYTVPAEKALMANVTARGTFRGGQPKFAAHYEIQLREGGWNTKVLDEGTHERLNSGRLRSITVDGLETTSPQYLDGRGFKIDTDGTAEIQPVYLEYQLHRKMQFPNFLD